MAAGPRSAGGPRVFGHRRGADSVRAVVEAADQLGVKVLSLYAFSEENWGRPPHEVMAIMTLLNTYLIKERDELNANNVQLRTMGRLERLPAKTLRLVRETEAMLAGNTGLVLNIALSYGGRSDIVEACRSVARRVQSGELAPQDINSEIVEASLACADFAAAGSAGAHKRRAALVKLHAMADGLYRILLYVCALARLQ